MRERPILFSGPMVRAIDDGSKTQTRRVVKFDSGGYIVERGGKRRWHRDDPEAVAACPYGQPSDRLWVKEAYRYDGWMEDGEPFIKYAADGCVRSFEFDDIPDAWGDRITDIWIDLCMPENVARMGRAVDPKWRPSIHMPRWASRYTLEVVDVRVQRLQDISEDDARAEGVKIFDGPLYPDEPRSHYSYRDQFAKLWDSINANRSPWSRNDWVWAVTFRRVEP